MVVLQTVGSSVSIVFRDSERSEYALGSQYTKILNALGILIC